MIREDQSDLIYKTEGRPSTIAVVDDVAERYAKGQPVLIAPPAERSSTLSRQFTKQRIPHTCFNAKYHEQEATTHHRGGGSPRRRHRRHQHGRSRHRHSWAATSTSPISGRA